MPIIEVKVFEQRFDGDESASLELIRRLTDAIGEVYGPEAREETWVILEGVKPSRWGFAGKPRP